MAIRDSRLAPRASKKKKGRRQKAVGVGEEDFIPWVPPISCSSSDREEEEKEEDDMSGLVHNFTARKRKRDAILEQATNAAPEVARGSSQPGPDGGSEVQVIVISGSPDISLDDQPVTSLKKSREGAQEIVDRWGPFNRGESLADHLQDLYPTMLRMPVIVRVGG